VLGQRALDSVRIDPYSPCIVTESEPFVIRALAAGEARRRIDELSSILVDCVEGGASVSFMLPITRERTDAFWNTVADGVAANDRILVVAEDRAAGTIVGTVQVVFAWPENQPHRADIAKMLVHRSERRRGLGARLIAAAEEAAHGAGRTLLVLDTVTGSDADRLYTRLGWTRVGDVPDYALWPDGRPCSTTFFYKRVGRA
jgi:GNAT superfamily N-acetyltransferase